MGKIFKLVGIVFGSLLGLVVVASIVLYVVNVTQLSKVYPVQAGTISIPTDPAAVERGKVWVSSECKHCHGSNLAGQTVFHDPILATIASANLTSGQGGVPGGFSDSDWIRAIRHGLDTNGRTLVAMPSNDFYHFSDSDLGDIIAYLKTLPPVDKEQTKTVIRPVGKILLAAGAFGKIIPAEIIDHTAPRPSAPSVGVTPEYGKYVISVSGCKACHGADLTGGKDPNPDAPPAPDLTPGGELGSWSEQDFIWTIREGVTPTGKPLSAYMPWSDFRNMTEEQLRAIWAYLRTLPAD